VAARHDQPDVVRTLHEYGCDLEQCSSSGSSALHYAASLGSMHAAMSLVDCGVSLDARDHEGWTPLHRAVHADQLTLAR
jgi:ankyrin repeat protein